MVEMRGIDLHLRIAQISVRLDKISPAALIRAAFRWVRFPLINKKTALWAVFLLVEMRGIEPLSESNLEGTSPGAVCYLHSLRPAGTNTLRPSVAS